MAINDDQMDDLSNGSILDNDDDVIQAPSAIAQSKQKLTVIPETEELRNQAVTLTKEYEAKLPAMDIQLQVVEGKEVKLADMEEVEAMIATKGTADQGAADTVHEVFENLYDNSLKRNHFTATPTQVNFGRLKTHMRNRVALEEMALVSSIHTLMKEPVENAIAILTELSDKYLPALERTSCQLHSAATSLAGKVGSAQNTIIRIGEEFANITSLPLSNTEVETNLREFDEIRKDFAKLFECKKLVVHLHTVANDRAMEYSMRNEYILEYQDKDVLLETILDYFRNMFVIRQPDLIKEQIAVTIAKMEKEKEETKDFTHCTMADTKEYLKTHAVELKDLAQYHIHTVKFVRDLIELNYLAERLFNFYNTRLEA